MQAAFHDRYGSPDVVELREVERPVPVEDEVLVRVKAASVNRADLDTLQPRPGFIRLAIGVRAPRNRRIGIDMAGRVEEVGPAATRFKPGDEVFADLFAHGQGAFSEYVCAAEAAFAPMRPGISFEAAATLPHSGILALQGLRRRDGSTVQPGDRVLIVGASGNVGPFAVQLAKLRGAEVTGVCQTSKMDLVRSIGADHVIDYTRVDFTRTGERYDWILDTDAHHSVFAVQRALAPRGSYVTLGGTTWPLLGALVLGPLVSLVTHRWTGLMLWWKPFDQDDAATLGELVAQGQLRPVIDRRYPLSKVVEALRYVDEGLARGKVILTT